MKRDASRNVLKRRKRKKLKQPKPGETYGTEENRTEQEFANRERTDGGCERTMGKGRVDEKTANGARRAARTRSVNENENENERRRRGEKELVG